ncbi:pentapeptide repeat-containing protein [Parasphingorhabdus sp.]|uniref:pentapeptide repeat-containing protein n=1 Tax=Parasphingorhabdus sp. TaxID=2709688 RepID=UPI003266F945
METRLIGLKSILSLLAAHFIIIPAHATSPPLRCADLVVAADRAREEITDQAGKYVVHVDGATVSDVGSLQAQINADGIEAAIIVGGDFQGWDFTNMSLAPACFVDSNLSNSIWFKASLQGAAFVRTNLEGSNFRASDIAHVYFDNSNLKGLDARGANLSWGRFGGGWFEGSIEGWNIDDANMTGFTFECGITLSDGCPLYQGGAEMSAKGTEFSGATLHSFGLYNVDLTGAILNQTIIGPRQFPHLINADFRGDIILRGGDSDVRLTSEEALRLLTENAKQKSVEAQPAFDCTKAASKVEQEICGEYSHDLRAMDRKMSSLYKKAKAFDPAIKASQRAWLKQRNGCGGSEYPADCLRETYGKRIGALLVVLGPTEWLARGEAALFTDDLLSLPESFTGTDLYSKIAPSLVGASMAEILVERGEDGLYAIKGSAVGANAHLCSLYAWHLYFDRKTGWYIPVSEEAALPIFRIFGNRLEIFANGRPDYKKYPDASKFMSCGMRASFSEVLRVETRDAVIERYRKSLNEEM